MATISRTYTFSDGTTAYGSQVETEIDTISDAHNNHDSGASRWTVVDGTTFKQVGNTAYPVLAQGVASAGGAQLTTTNTTATVVGNASVTITPKATTSKILLIFTSVIGVTGSIGRLAFYKDSTNLASATNSFVQSSSTATVPVHLVFLDSPATTSSITYAVYGWIDSGAQTLTVGAAGNVGVMQIIEIGF